MFRIAFNTQLKITIQHKLIQAAVQVVSNTAVLLSAAFPYISRGAKFDIRYNTTATTDATANATCNKYR